MHHVIWEETHKRKVPPGHVVVFRDGNKNNHAPENLALKPRAAIAVEQKLAPGSALQRSTG